MIHKLSIFIDESKITARAREVVKDLVANGHDTQDIARLTDTTVLSLLEGASPRLGRPQYEALARHYNVSRFWLWTGLGPQYLRESTKVKTA